MEYHEPKVRVVYNQREIVAIFAGKCSILHDMVEQHGEIPDDVLDSMFDQSALILGVQ